MTDLVKATFYLVPEAEQALESAVKLTSYTHQDSANRAIQLYAAVLRVLEHGGGQVDVTRLQPWRGCSLEVRPGRELA